MELQVNKYSANAATTAYAQQTKEKFSKKSRRKQCSFGLYMKARIMLSNYISVNAVF